jgi:hypothetical protein
MAETKGNGEDPATHQSSGTPFRLSGKRHTEQPVLGAIESFGSYVFKYNTSDQVDMYNRTYEHLIGYVTKEYGSDMKNLVKYQQEKAFTKPKAPTAAARKDNDLLVICLERRAVPLPSGGERVLRPKGESIWSDPRPMFRRSEKQVGEHTNVC